MMVYCTYECGSTPSSWRNTKEISSSRRWRRSQPSSKWPWEILKAQRPLRRSASSLSSGCKWYINEASNCWRSLGNCCVKQIKDATQNSWNIIINSQAFQQCCGIFPESKWIQATHHSSQRGKSRTFPSLPRTYKALVFSPTSKSCRCRSEMRSQVTESFEPLWMPMKSSQLDTKCSLQQLWPSYRIVSTCGHYSNPNIKAYQDISSNSGLDAVIAHSSLVLPKCFVHTDQGNSKNLTVALLTSTNLNYTYLTLNSDSCCNTDCSGCLSNRLPATVEGSIGFCSYARSRLALGPSLLHLESHTTTGQPYTSKRDTTFNRNCGASKHHHQN